ncbi:hypothetical protein P8891_12055 [Bacillus atrophaeus]|uniref:hypothetical protein n=1 Tax=Bacillus atrophaeus TaxID=1452 RepID=UPI002282B4CE|nr:hypothetical protein [Bacillus atrophaeus]MCY7948345.1 hypothetical protein [Bacillus atrophaeus]MCY8098606.1 hypothetical protein [Bacillus atrophaeus]MCY9167857.1 hypothetical protein [Bacillus atrophaeus]MEC0741796.1 hypothetical protein [Bacillus atrophaeus]MEC0744890.1 hypothetical protein [Bacillus atrophaeus]
MKQTEEELLIKKEQLELEALEKEAELLKLEIENEYHNLNNIVELGIMKDFLLYIKKHRAMFSVNQAKEFRLMDDRMKSIVSIKNKRVKVDEEKLDEFIEEIDERVKENEEKGEI